MSIRGLVDGPDQISDGVDPALLANVDKTGAIKIQPSQGVDPAGGVGRLRADAHGRMMISDADVFRQVLVELRLLTSIMAEANYVTESLDGMRTDIMTELKL